MKREFLTDEQVEREIERLNESPAVALGRLEQRIKYRRRQYMYTLRNHEKRGLELMERGVTYDELKRMDLEILDESAD